MAAGERFYLPFLRAGRHKFFFLILVLPIGDRINASANEHFPTFSPDEQYIFFVSDRISDEFKNHENMTVADVQKKLESPMKGSSDIYWVSATISEELSLTDLK